MSEAASILAITNRPARPDAIPNRPFGKVKPGIVNCLTYYYFLMEDMTSTTLDKYFDYKFLLGSIGRLSNVVGACVNFRKELVKENKECKLRVSRFQKDVDACYASLTLFDANKASLISKRAIYSLVEVHKFCKKEA